MAVQDIVHCLNGLSELYAKLAEIGEQKKQAIIQNSIDELNLWVNQESRILRQITDLEHLRQASVDKFLIGKGYRPHPNVTVTDLIKLTFHAKDKVALQEAQVHLANMINRLKAINELNQKLIDQSLTFVNYSLGLYTGESGDEAVYRHPSHQSHYGAKRPGFFDTRA